MDGWKKRAKNKDWLEPINMDQPTPNQDQMTSMEIKTKPTTTGYSLSMHTKNAMEKLCIFVGEWNVGQSPNMDYFGYIDPEIQTNHPNSNHQKSPS